MEIADSTIELILGSFALSSMVIGGGAIGFGFLLSASSFHAMFAVAAAVAPFGSAAALSHLRR